MTGRLLFGTDGIRGEANVYPMTVDIALALGRSLAQLVREGVLGRNQVGHRKRIVIGKDTRLSGYCFEQAIAAGICAMGVDVLLVGPLPTPGIAFITQSMRADAGVVVSASHNSFEDNGVKIFGHEGYKLVDRIEIALEKLILGQSPAAEFAVGNAVGRTVRIDDAVGRYVVFLKSVFPNDKTLDGMRIVLDCANGAAYRVAPEVFAELGAEVYLIGCEPNGMNINSNVGAIFPLALQKRVLETKAHIGIALDGDGDRAVFVDEKGEVVDGDAALALVAIYLQQKGLLSRQAMVSTIVASFGLETCLSGYGIALERAQVGDRHVVGHMQQKGVNFGGEPSGHMVFLNHGTTGDGVMAGLHFVAMMVESQKSLSLLKQAYVPAPKITLNVPVPFKIPLDNLPKTTALIRQIEKQLAPHGRVLVRYSGTEKKVRILLEAFEADTGPDLAQAIASCLLEEMGKSKPLPQGK